MPRYILLKQTPSTNTYLSRTASQLPHGTVIWTHNQTAGRGQKGNSWEAEPGMNLTFSMLIKGSSIPPQEQFCLSEAVTIAIARECEARGATNVKIKWPNDIYSGDHKLCGILIENSLATGAIEHSVVGVGLNVNQTEWRSNAPNPVSLRQLTGNTFNLEEVLHSTCERIDAMCSEINTAQGRATTHRQYLSLLYRNDGAEHPFADAQGTPFNAKIANVAPDGVISLRLSNGELKHFYFKQVKHIINNITL